MAKKVDDSASGLAFVGCVIAGVGIGVATENPGAGAMIGTGVGFLIMSIMRSNNK